MIFLRNKVSGAAPAFDPATLFSSGEEGLWYAPSPSTCFTDTPGTTPAGVGDAVAKMDDLSGNGYHATQGSAAARPILRQTGGGLYYLEYDGIDDHLEIQVDMAATFTSTQVFVGLEIEDDAGLIFQRSSKNLGNYEDGNTSTNLGSAGTITAWAVNGAAITETRDGLHDALRDAPRVLEIKADDLTSLTLGTDFLSARVTGKLFGAIISPDDDATETTNIRAYMASLAGVTL
jgi:hypothetical protein